MASFSGCSELMVLQRLQPLRRAFLNYKAIIKCEIAPFRNIAAASCHSVALRICLTSPLDAICLSLWWQTHPPLSYYYFFFFRERNIIE